MRDRIWALAKEMGWKPNPLVHAWQTQVRMRRAPVIQAALAWINDHPAADYWQRPWSRPLRDAARARAEALGFSLDEIWLGEAMEPEAPERNIRRFMKVLQARGIYGVVLPFLERAHHAALEWQDMAVVCLGRQSLLLERSSFPLRAPVQYHLVTSDDFANTRTALRRLREAGCRRVGLAISVWEDRGTDGLCSAAYLLESASWPARQRVPILLSDEREKVIPWVQKHRPDAIVCAHGAMKAHVEAAGFSVPGQVRLAHLNLAEDVAGWSGIDRRLADLGSAAVDLLTAHLARNERGIPPFPKVVLIPGMWVEGQT